MTLLQFFNQHSYLVGCAIVLSAAAIVLYRRRARRAWWLWLGAAVIALAGWLVLRTGDGTSFNSVEDYEAMLRSGQPTLVEFYSDY